MTHRFTAAVSKAKLNLRSALFTRNFYIFPQLQPKRHELQQFHSQLSSYSPKGFDKPLNQRKGNKSGAFTAGGISTDRNSSSLSGGADGQIQMVIDSGFLPNLMQLLNHQQVDVQEAAAGAVWKIVNGSSGEMQAVLDCDALSHLRNLLNQPKNCKWALAVLAMVSAKNFATVQAIIDAELIPLIVRHLEEGELETQKAAVWAVRCINVSANTEQQAHLIDCGVIPPLCNLLNSNDSDKAQDGILNILLMTSGNQESRHKVCTLIKECGGWDKIKTPYHSNMENFPGAHDTSIIIIPFFD